MFCRFSEGKYLADEEVLMSLPGTDESTPNSLNVETSTLNQIKICKNLSEYLYRTPTRSGVIQIHSGSLFVRD